MSFNFCANIFYFKVCAFIYSKTTCPTDNKYISSTNMPITQPLSLLLLNSLKNSKEKKTNKRSKHPLLAKLRD